MRPVALLVVLAALPGAGLPAAAPATAHESAQDVPAAEPVARAGLERRQTLPPTPPIPPILEVSGALRGGAQWVLNPPRARDDVFGFGALDAVVVLRPTPNVTLLADVETIVGPGPDAALGSLSRVNEESERLFGDDTRVFLREAWIRLQSSDASIRLNVGKLDVQHYFDRNFFAEDETRQFLNAALVGNPLLAPPPNGPGASLRISRGDWRYAVGVHAPGDVDDDLSGCHTSSPSSAVAASSRSPATIAGGRASAPCPSVATMSRGARGSASISWWPPTPACSCAPASGGAGASR